MPLCLPNTGRRIVKGKVDMKTKMANESREYNLLLLILRTKNLVPQDCTTWRSLHDRLGPNAVQAWNALFIADGEWWCNADREVTLTYASLDPTEIDHAAGELVWVLTIQPSEGTVYAVVRRWRRLPRETATARAVDRMLEYFWRYKRLSSSSTASYDVIAVNSKAPVQSAASSAAGPSQRVVSEELGSVLHMQPDFMSNSNPANRRGCEYFFGMEYVI